MPCLCNESVAGWPRGSYHRLSQTDSGLIPQPVGMSDKYLTNPLFFVKHRGSASEPDLNWFLTDS